MLAFAVRRGDYSIPKVIAASAVGTMIEWYDFYIFGSLATVISPLFYPPGNDTLALIAYLSTFAVGFVVRPFGALFFGRIGDIVGTEVRVPRHAARSWAARRRSSACLPTYATIGLAAPIILLVIRMLQGLALGGEYGGAAVYVAEHVPDGQPRLLHQLHPDHRDTRPVRLAGRHPHRPEHDDARDVPRVGLAHAVS